MPLAGTVAIAIWNDIANEKREQFFEWHPREHVPERLGIPGFVRGRRFRAVGEGIEFLTLYELEAKDVITAESYKRRLATPTPWSLDVLPGFRNNLRGVCDVRINSGHVDGAFFLTRRFSPPPGAEAATQARIEEWTTALLQLSQVCGVELLICDQSMSSTNTALQRGRTITPPDWVLMVEAISLDGAQAARRFMENQTAGFATDRVDETAIYQLEYHLSRLTVAPEVE
jgi:hypothetical protein